MPHIGTGLLGNSLVPKGLKMKIPPVFLMSLIPTLLSANRSFQKVELPYTTSTVYISAIDLVTSEPVLSPQLTFHPYFIKDMSPIISAKTSSTIQVNNLKSGDNYPHSLLTADGYTSQPFHFKTAPGSIPITSHTVVMTKGIEVMGKVIDRITKKPVGHIPVSAHNCGDNPGCLTPIAETLTDINGEFLLSGIPITPALEVQVVPPAPYIPTWKYIPDSAHPKIDAGTLEIGTGATFIGKLINADDTPSSGTKVSFEAGHPMETVELETLTDADGNFQFHGLKDYVFHLQADGLTGHYQFKIDPHQTIKIQLKKGRVHCRIKVKINGNPAKEVAGITLRPYGIDFSHQMITYSITEKSPGEFESKSIPPGKFTMVIHFNDPNKPSLEKTIEIPNIEKFEHVVDLPEK